MKNITLFFIFFISLNTFSQAVLLRDIETGSDSSMPTYIKNRVDFNGELLFTVYNSTTDDYHLWKTDGTESGTQLLKTLVDYNTSPSQYYTYSSALNKVFFSAIETFNGTQSFLYSSDGTSSNTILVSGSATNLREATSFGSGIMYVGANNFNSADIELFYFDGNTHNIIELISGSQGSFPSQLKTIGSKLYFSARASLSEGAEPCISDGTIAGTYRLKDINIGNNSSEPKDFFEFNNKVYFTADNGTNGRELWVTDSTEANTQMVADMHPGNNPSFYVDPNFTIYKNELYFTGFTPATGVELFKVDVNGNISNVSDINPGASNHSYPKDLFIYDNKLFFTADDGTNGFELWYTENTGGATSKAAVTTAIFKNINPNGDSNPTNFIEFDGKLYFNADDGTNGKELWETDGTVAGTILKQNINATGDSNPRDFVISNNLLYFSADDGINGDELWKYSNNFTIGMLSPADNALDFPISGQDLSITLNKNLIKGTGNIIIYNQVDDTVFETINVTSNNVIINDNTVKITPSLNFVANQEYYIFIDNGALKDNSNNNFIGINDKTIWNFKVADRQNQTITFNALADKTFGDADFQLQATSTSGLPISFTSSNLNVATVNGNTVTIVGTGATLITASQSGNANYNAAQSVQQAFVVNKGNQTITFNALANKTFGDADFQLTATSSSNLPISYSSSNTNVVTISGNVVTIVGAGTTTITANQSGNNNYNAATPVSQNLTIDKTSQTISWNTIADQTYGGSNFPLGASASSNLPVSYSSSNTNVATVNGNIVTIVGAGSTNITASQSGNTNYNAAQDITETLTVKKGIRNVTIDAIPLKKFGDPNFFITSSVDGIPQNDNTVYHYYAGNSNVSIDFNTGEVSINGTGTFGFTVDYIETANYLANQANGSFTVQKADQTITFNALADVAVNDSDFSLTATSSSGLAIAYSSSDPSVASITGNIVSINSIGSTTITASQTGNNNYNAATPVTQNLTVTTTASTKDFNSIGVKLFPNPVSSHFELIHNTNIKSIKIYNTIGQKIKEFNQLKNSKFQINDLKKGVYLMLVTNEKGTAATRIIKK